MGLLGGLGRGWDACYRGIRRAGHAFDRWQTRHRWPSIASATLVKYGQDEGGRWAALLAHYGFLSLLPTLLLLVTALGYVLDGRPGLEQSFLHGVLDQIPVLGDQLGSDVTSLSGNGVALLVGLAGAVWGGAGILRVTHDALDRFAGVPRDDRIGFPWLHLRVLVVGLVLVVLVLVGAGAAATTAGLTWLPGTARLAAAVGSLVLSTAVLAIAFGLLGTGRRRWGEVLPGALAGALGWSVVHGLGGLYLNRVVIDASLTYGAFAVVIGLIAWMYLQARVFVLAAILNEVLEQRLWPRRMFGPEVPDASP